MNRLLYTSAEFLSKPPGFYFLLLLMAGSAMLVPFGWTDVVTFALSVAAIVITGVVLIQGYRDTAAIHAKLDELVVAFRETRNDVVGLEHQDPKRILAALERLEREANGGGRQASPPQTRPSRSSGRRSSPEKTPRSPRRSRAGPRI